MQETYSQFTTRIQEGLSLPELVESARAHHTDFITGLLSVLGDDSSHDDIQVTPIESFSEMQAIPVGEATLYNPGIKNYESARRKANHNLGGVDSAHKDGEFCRATITMQNPQQVESFIEKAKETFPDMFDCGWIVRPSGNACRILYIKIADHLIGQILFRSPQQMAVEELNHRAYEVRRLIMGETGGFDTSHSSPDEIRNFRHRFTALMSKASQEGFINPGSYSAADFTPDNLQERFKDTLRVEQIVTARSLSASSKEWQELFIPLFEDLNACHDNKFPVEMITAPEVLRENARERNSLA